MGWLEELYQNVDDLLKPPSTQDIRALLYARYGYVPQDQVRAWQRHYAGERMDKPIKEKWIQARAHVQAAADHLRKAARLVEGDFPLRTWLGVEAATMCQLESALFSYFNDSKPKEKVDG